MSSGNIVQIIGAVVDVEFPSESIPKIYDALLVIDFRDLCLIGTKAVGYFNRFKEPIVGQSTHLGDKPTVDVLIGTVKIMLDSFNEGKIDRLFLISNKFVNSMTQDPIKEQLLPVQASEEEELKHHWDYIYEPDAKDILDHLLTRYIESLVYQGVVENIACEQAARMIAMKSASDNAGTLIDDCINSNRGFTCLAIRPNVHSVSLKFLSVGNCWVVSLTHWVTPLMEKAR